MMRISKLFPGSSAAVLAFTMAMLATPARADNTPECDPGLGIRNTDCGVNALTSFSGTNNTAVGAEAETIDQDSFFGTINNVTAIGAQSKVFKDSGTALGANAQARALNAEALGAGATATAANATALGQGSLADQAFTVSVGRSDLQRRIVNVADGIDDNDAVSMRQLNNALGNAPNILDEAKTYTDVRETLIRTDMVAGDAATLDAANDYTDTRETSIRADMVAGDAATLSAANGYTDTRETAIRAEIVAGDASTLADANTYTDTRETQIRGDMTAADNRIEGLANTAQQTADTAIVHVDALGASAAAALGGGSAYNASTGAVSAPSYSIGGQNFNNVGAAFSAIDNRLGGIDARLSGLDFDIRRLDRLVGRGVAIATAMASIPPLDGDKKIGVGFGTGTYDGRFAFSAAIIGRVSDSAQFRLNAGTTGNGKIAAGGGMTFGW